MKQIDTTRKKLLKITGIDIYGSFYSKETIDEDKSYTMRNLVFGEHAKEIFDFKA